MIKNSNNTRVSSYFTSPTRVQSSCDQHHLDILKKNRSNTLAWRGQFSPQLVEYLLAKNCNEGSRVLDPFCGSGTVLREAARLGFSAVGLDINPAAICLAKISKLSEVTPEHRRVLIGRIRKLGLDLLLCSDHQGVVGATEAANIILKSPLSEQEKIALEGALLFLFSNNKYIIADKVSKGIDRYLSVIFDFDACPSQIEANIGDARSIDEVDDSFDYLLTSPPYVNVFNYHQNYRPIIEALGYDPLKAAKSEIGANRKFRQNRYMTVVQYCMDIAQFFVEANRVLRDKAKLTIVLGRMSSIRSVPFKNGELVNSIACEGMGYRLLEWNERKFVNRFGKIIYEDVITMTTNYFPAERAVDVAREVGVRALINSKEYCQPERLDEISDAIALAPKITPSLLTRSEISG